MDRSKKQVKIASGVGREEHLKKSRFVNTRLFIVLKTHADCGSSKGPLQQNHGIIKS